MSQTQKNPLAFSVPTEVARDLFKRLVGEEDARTLLTDRETYDKMAQKTHLYHTEAGFKPAMPFHVITSDKHDYNYDIVVTYGYTLYRDLDDTAFTVAVIPEKDEVVFDLSLDYAITPSRTLPSTLRPGHGDYEILRQWAQDNNLDIPLETLNAGMLLPGNPFEIRNLSIEEAASLGRALNIGNVPINSDHATALAHELQDDENVSATMKNGVYTYYSTSKTVFLLDFNNGTASMAIPEERAQSGGTAYERTRNWCEDNKWVYADFEPHLPEAPDEETIDEDFFDRLQDQLVEAHKAKALSGR
jgi:hypothetical protein